MKKVLCAFVLSLSTMALVGGCTTAMYSQPAAISTTQNIYSFTIKTSGFAGGDTADQRATSEINAFMAANGYKTYKILSRTDEFSPSGYKYTVQFFK